MSFSLRVALVACASVASASIAAAQTGTAWVENRSHETRCAEFDNVYYTFSGADVRSFAIDVTPPVYLADLDKDDTAPNFADCDAMKEDPKNHFTPKQVTLYDDGETRVVGHTYAESWRARGAEVTVGDKSESDLHLVQLFQKVDGQFVEYLVVYPFDGYWRAKPIPPQKFPDAAYGTSFLIGPVEEQHRPIVDMKTLVIDPKARAFRMTFAKGGEGELKVTAANRERVAVEVSLRDLPKQDPAPPFAAIRSMFVTPTNADASRINWRTPGGIYNEPIMNFRGADASEVRFDRIELSRHNTSAPDVTFRDFSTGR